MEVVTVLRVLWRRRIALAVGCVFAVAVAVAVGRSPSAPGGLAKARVVVDTPQSQLVRDDPAGAQTLPWRATLAAMTLGTKAAREQMAREAEVPIGQLAVTDLELTFPPVPASLPRAATSAANTTTEPYVLTVYTDDVLPVVVIETAAPTRYKAARLAQAAIYALQTGVSPITTEEQQGLSVQQSGAVRSRTVPGAAGRKKMAAIAVVLIGLWVVALVTGPLLSGVRRTVRQTRAVGF
jgi:hypothetical protein